MKVYLIVLTMFLLFSLFVVGSEAIPTCTFRTTCNSGEVCVFELLQENNTHVGSCDSDYTTKICCTELTSATIRTSCNSDEGGVISVYATSNAHAGRKDYYSNVICAKTSSNPVVTNIRTSCLSRENCVASVFQQNNTHVGACSHYSNKLCIQELFNVTITMILNNTSPNWNETVRLEGVATRSDGTVIDTSADPEDVRVYSNSTNVCITDTNSSGGYTCNFSAPLAIGLYQLNVTVSDPTTSKTWSNTTTFNVKQKFGDVQTGEVPTSEGTAESIACYEEPRIVQNPDGTIEVAIVRICVWK